MTPPHDGPDGLKNTLSRRELLSAAALLALGLGGAAHASTAAPERGADGRRIGISDEAYARARARADALVVQMTLAEKITQVGDYTSAVARLNIPSYNYYSAEALHGLCTGPQVTSFPVPLALAAAWNPSLARQVYVAVADECRAHGNLSLYSPATLNLHRDPRWGRCYEAPGEDPCLASTLAVQVVRGMQGDDPAFLKTTACSKHFICNNTENDRTSVSATVDARSFWEYYTRAYRATVVHGDVFTFMSAYSALNGVPCSASPELLTDLLRGQWGFRGYVNSDCDAIANIYDPHHYTPDYPTAAALAIKAGCEVNCGDILQKYLPAAVDRGLVTEAQIGEAVARILTVRALLGTLDPPEKVPYAAITMATVPWQAHAALAVEAARQSLVLLKNDAHFLPLDPAKVQKVAVIGPLGKVCHLGAYSGNPAVTVSPLQGIAARLGLAPTLPDHLEGGDAAGLHGSITTQVSPFGTFQLAYISDGDWARFRALDLTAKTELRVKAASNTAGGTISVHLDTVDGPSIGTLTLPGTGGWDQWKDLTLPLTGITGVHDLFLVFHGGTGYLMNVERLTLLPASPTAWTGGRQVVFSAGCGVTGDRDDAAFAEAVGVAKGADVVVMVCGIDVSVDGEGYDREALDLTGAQPELIQAVYAANPNVVLVLSSNNSVAVNWEQAHLPAILGMLCAGQSQGTALAEALFGDYNPGGKLPCTWYRSADQLPPTHDYDIHKGRTYMYFGGDPLYPFGHGLSYTTFHLEGLRASVPAIGPGETAKVSVRVANTGRRAGAEVVQLYVVPPPSPVQRPRRQLIGFQRVVLEPGERKTVVFEVPATAQAFWYWDEAEKRFACPPGTATLEVGDSSAHLPLKVGLTLKGAHTPLPQPDAVETVAVSSYVV